jgi:hypothetical protein
MEVSLPRSGLTRYKPKVQTPLGAFQDFWFEGMQIQYFKTVKPVKSKVLEINSSKSIPNVHEPPPLCGNVSAL